MVNFSLENYFKKIFSKEEIEKMKKFQGKVQFVMNMVESRMLSIIIESIISNANNLLQIQLTSQQIKSIFNYQQNNKILL